jgi:hypothetical protein
MSLKNILLATVVALVPVMAGSAFAADSLTVGFSQI